MATAAADEQSLFVPLVAPLSCSFSSVSLIDNAEHMASLASPLNPPPKKNPRVVLNDEIGSIIELIESNTY